MRRKLRRWPRPVVGSFVLPASVSRLQYSSLQLNQTEHPPQSLRSQVFAGHFVMNYSVAVLVDNAAKVPWGCK